MSYFGTCLDELLKRKNIKAVELAKMSGIGEPMISRYRKGDQTWVSTEDLAALAHAISDNPSEQAELIRARLLDECRGPGSELISISISGPARYERPLPYLVKLPDELEAHLATIREFVIKDKNVRDIVEGLGSLLRTGDLQIMEDRTGKPNSDADADKPDNLEEDIVDLLKDKAPKKKKPGARQK